MRDGRTYWLRDFDMPMLKRVWYVSMAPLRYSGLDDRDGVLASLVSQTREFFLNTLWGIKNESRRKLEVFVPVWIELDQTNSFERSLLARNDA
jgi:hypothetical protein